MLSVYNDPNEIVNYRLIQQNFNSNFVNQVPEELLPWKGWRYSEGNIWRVTNSEKYLSRKYPVFINIKRNFTDNSAIFTIRWHKAEKNGEYFGYNRTCLWHLDRKTFKNVGNGFYEVSFYADDKGRKINFDDLESIEFIDLETRGKRNTEFAHHWITIKNMKLSPETKNPQNFDGKNNKMRFIYEIDYTIGANVKKGSFINNKDCSVKYLEVDTKFNDLSNIKGSEKIAEIKYQNLTTKDKKPLQMEQKFMNLFTLNSLNVELNSKKHYLEYKTNVKKSDNHWDVEIYNDVTHELDKKTKNWIAAENGHEKGFLLPLNFSGEVKHFYHFNTKFHWSNYYEYSQQIEEKILDFTKGKIKLYMDNKEIDWQALELNQEVNWKFISLG
ncbi:hypothetical protein PUW95_00965 [Metamycoplasma hyosynoviae]|uniref:MHO_1580 family protein n=1 Tax=Metamycoplasma hyosynoviae TaxID=29559 RepID=UPI002366134F|nr:hypothetical protein [Metamycoplasma hyosynoviae]MDD7897307.1 hypothetical protein [Metamycoplasma hyosynoviae]